MKRIIYHLVLIAVVTITGLCVSDLLNKWLILSAPSSSSYKTYRMFVEKPKGEIPLLGSSRALGNYMPSLISSRVFDYGINGSGMYETLLFLREALKNPESGHILVNLDPWGFHGEYKTSLQGNYKLALSSLVVRENTEWSFADLIPGIRFHGNLRGNLTTYLDGKTSLTRKIDQGAALLLNSRSKKEWEHINSKIEEQTFECHPSWITEINKLNVTTNHPVIWVVGPVSPHWREHYNGNEKMKNFLAHISSIPNMYVVNLFDDTVDYTEAEFADPTHLNIRGAERFTKLLVQKLNSLPIPYHKK